MSYPSSVRLTSNLSNGAQLFVFSIRQWQIATHQSECPHVRLLPFYRRFGVEPALPLLDEMMSLINLASFRPLEVNCPCRCDVGEDEQALLACLQSMQSGDGQGVGSALDDFFVGPFKATFRRIAQIYLEIFTAVGLSMKPIPQLRVVDTEHPQIH